MVTCKQRHTIAQFIGAKGLGEIPTGSPLTGTLNRGGVGYSRRRLTNISLYLRNGAR